MDSALQIIIARSSVYAIFSRLVSSPFDGHEMLDDAREILAEIQNGLPFNTDFKALISESETVSSESWNSVVQSYSTLFEVGDNGPQIPVRESADPLRAVNREEVNRYYKYFGYQLNECHQWESDHLSIELEFIHFLCQGELTAADDSLSFRLAQRDFVDRHLTPWVASIVHQMGEYSAHAYWTAIFSTLHGFVRKDLQWLKTELHQLKEVI